MPIKKKTDLLNTIESEAGKRLGLAKDNREFVALSKLILDVYKVRKFIDATDEELEDIYKAITVSKRIPSDVKDSLLRWRKQFVRSQQ